ncbi:TonB-dependent receptor plug domain-containing protein [Novosphingobium sp. ST904]|uniref:TonB-dependent receptor plug domain-containing protein n=1 Tax=Novosphingobium sp. ST904 TaxID=1684385 RepID=UPI000B1B551E|nr:Plug domain-containing protein [Novosphingobium sp. ST904]
MVARNFRAALMAGAALGGTTAAMPALAQSSPTINPGEIIVTARRTEERLQDVPISITVFNQEQLNNRNVVSASDLATSTPSLSANNNFGSQNSSFAIRGFVQEIGTAPAVGVYFADVVSPRGASNGLPSGDAPVPAPTSISRTSRSSKARKARCSVGTPRAARSCWCRRSPPMCWRATSRAPSAITTCAASRPS